MKEKQEKKEEKQNKKHEHEGCCWMKNKFLAAGVLGILLISVTGVFALTSNPNKNESVDQMDEMHKQMTKNIQDPELKKAMDDMHKDCMKEMNEGEMGSHHGQNVAGNSPMMGGMMGMH